MTFQYDPAQARQALCAADPKLAAAIERAGPFNLELRRWPQPFHALLRSITYQQLSGKAAATIFGRFLALFPGSRYPSPEAVLALPDAALRGAGLSGAKTAAIKDLAAKTLTGVVPSRQKLRYMSDDEIVEHLIQVRGIGRWTVEMLLIFDLGRADVMPATDLGIRKGFQIVYNKRKLPEPAAILKHSKRWQPYRSMASWYLWRIVDVKNGGELW